MTKTKRMVPPSQVEELLDRLAESPAGKALVEEASRERRLKRSQAIADIVIAEKTFADSLPGFDRHVAEAERKLEPIRKAFVAAQVELAEARNQKDRAGFERDGKIRRAEKVLFATAPQEQIREAQRDLSRFKEGLSNQPSTTRQVPKRDARGNVLLRDGETMMETISNHEAVGQRIRELTDAHHQLDGLLLARKPEGAVLEEVAAIRAKFGV